MRKDEKREDKGLNRLKENKLKSLGNEKAATDKNKILKMFS